jgi:hypothetical protein
MLLYNVVQQRLTACTAATTKVTYSCCVLLLAQHPFKSAAVDANLCAVSAKHIPAGQKKQPAVRRILQVSVQACLEIARSAESAALTP